MCFACPNLASEMRVLHSIGVFVNAFAQVGQAPTKALAIALRAIGRNAQSSEYNDCRVPSTQREMESAAFMQILDYARDINPEMQVDMADVEYAYRWISEEMTRGDIEVTNDTTVAFYVISDCIFRAVGDAIDMDSIESVVKENIMLFNAEKQFPLSGLNYN